jgi:hypothetical protein
LGIPWSRSKSIRSLKRSPKQTFPQKPGDKSFNRGRDGETGGAAGELERLDRNASDPVIEWRDINWDRNWIHVRHEVAKQTGAQDQSRYIPLEPAAAEWLRMIPVRTTRIMEISRLLNPRRLVSSRNLAFSWGVVRTVEILLVLFGTEQNAFASKEAERNCCFTLQAIG